MKVDPRNVKHAPRMRIMPVHYSSPRTCLYVIEEQLESGGWRTLPGDFGDRENAEFQLMELGYSEQPSIWEKA